MIPGRPVYSGQCPDTSIFWSITPEDPLDLPGMIPEHALPALQGKGYLRKSPIRATECRKNIGRLDQDRVPGMAKA
jgi:hypothetical protein